MCLHIAYKKEYEDYVLENFTSEQILEIVKKSVSNEDDKSFYLDWKGYNLCRQLGMLYTRGNEVIHYDIDVISDHLKGVYVRGKSSEFLDKVKKKLETI